MKARTFRMHQPEATWKSSHRLTRHGRSSLSAINRTDTELSTAACRTNIVPVVHAEAAESRKCKKGYAHDF